MRHATHSKLKENDSSWLPQLQWHQNCANNMLWWMGGHVFWSTELAAFDRLDPEETCCGWIRCCFQFWKITSGVSNVVSPQGSSKHHTKIVYFFTTKHQCSKKSIKTIQNKSYVLFTSVYQPMFDQLHDIILVFPYTVVVCLLFFSGQWLSETHRAGCCQVTQSPGGETEGRGNLNDL